MPSSSEHVLLYAVLMLLVCLLVALLVNLVAAVAVVSLEEFLHELPLLAVQRPAARIRPRLVVSVVDHHCLLPALVRLPALGHHLVPLPDPVADDHSNCSVVRLLLVQS